MNSVSLSQNYGNKKTWEYVSLVPIPTTRPSHCPHVRISNAITAHAVWYIHTTASAPLCTYKTSTAPTPIAGEVGYTLLYAIRNERPQWYKNHLA